MVTTIRGQLAMVLATLILAAPSVAPACVVGAGTSASCTEAALVDCLPGGGSFNGSVTFSCGGAKTITVTSTKTISANITINGGGVITISGGTTVGVFSVNAGVMFTAENLIIANGSSPSGGGIVNSGTVTVTNSTFSGNSALFGGGIFNDIGGTLTVTDSTFSGNSTFAGGRGGGISNETGTVTVTNSTFSGNSNAQGGGGINNENGTVTVTNSTFSGNSALFGGGISNETGTVTVTNSTFSGNSALFGGGGGGGGINNAAGTVTVTNTIIANSTTGDNCSGTITDGGHNLQFPGTTCGATVPVADPLLDPAGLRNNGGPTQTIALCLRAGTPAGCTGRSPAIDTADPVVCAAQPVHNIDQRGVPRSSSIDPICDIGAFEALRPSSAPAASTSALLVLALALTAVAWRAVRTARR